MRQLLRFCPVVLVALCLTGCDTRAVLDHYEATPEVVVARNVAEQLRQGDVEGIVKLFDVSRLKSDPHAPLRSAAGLFPSGAPQKTELVGYNWQNTNGVNSYTMVFQYIYPTRVLSVDIAYEQRQQGITLTTVSVNVLAEPLEKSGALDLAHLHPMGLVAIGLAVLSTTFSLVTFAYTWRSPIPRRRWLWRIFVLVGFCALIINTRTGNVAYRLVYIGIPVGTYTKELYQPVIISLYFPLGAILYWVRRPRWQSDLEVAAIQQGTSVAKIFE